MNLSLRILLVVSNLHVGLFAQVNFWHVSASAEKTMSDVGYQNMTAAWFVTGQDTVYSYRFQDGKNIARKTPFDADTLWAADDSLYHKYTSGQQEHNTLSVYFGNRLKRQTRFKNGKLESNQHWQHDSLGREIYHRQWSPNQVQTTIKHPNGKQEWFIESAYSDSKTIRKQHGDTNQVWVVYGRDTSNHRFNWEGYAEEKRYKQNYISREWRDGSIRTKVVRTPDFADSTLTKEYENTREMWTYRPLEIGEPYTLFQYFKVQGLKQLKSIYRLLPNSDTAHYTFETYADLGNGLHRKTQELRLRKDSNRYKQIDYFWRPNGEIEHLEITNRWGFKRKVTPQWQVYELPVGCSTGTMHGHIKDPPPIEYRFEIVSEFVKTIAVDGKSLERIIYNNLDVSTGGNDHLFEHRWQESIIFELDEHDIVKGVRRGPHSGLHTDGLQRALAGQEMQLPKGLKTTLFYTDIKGKQHVKQMPYILLPVEVLIRRR
jgi:hypothetical protein